MYMSARMSGGAQSPRPPLRHSTPPHSAIVLEQHRDTPWSCPSYPQPLIILSYSSCPYLFDLLIFATLDCKNLCPLHFSQAGSFEHTVFKLYIFDFQSLLIYTGQLVNQKRNYVKDLRLCTFFGIMHLRKSVEGKISMTITTLTFFTP